MSAIMLNCRSCDKPGEEQLRIQMIYRLREHSIYAAQCSYCGEERSFEVEDFASQEQINQAAYNRWNLRGE